METLKALSQLAWWVGIASLPLIVVECVGILDLEPWAFRLGIRAIVIEEEGERPEGLGKSSCGITEHLRYRVLVDQLCLFRPRFKLFHDRWSNPLQMMGSFTWREGKLTTSGRYPLGVTILVLIMLIGWTIGEILEPSGYPQVAIGWLFVIGWFIYSRRRFKTDAAELKSALQGNPSGT